jgi:hypothetical protein
MIVGGNISSANNEKFELLGFSGSNDNHLFQKMSLSTQLLFTTKPYPTATN